METEIDFESNSADREIIAAMAQAFTAMQLGGKKTFGALRISEIEFDMKCEIYAMAICELARESSGTMFEWKVSAGLILATAKSVARDPKVTELPDCAYFALLCRRMFESRTKTIGRDVLIGGLPTLVGRRVALDTPENECEAILDSIVARLNVDKPKALPKPIKGAPTLAMVEKSLSINSVKPIEQTEQEAAERRKLLRKQALSVGRTG